MRPEHVNIGAALESDVLRGRAEQDRQRVGFFVAAEKKKPHENDRHRHLAEADGKRGEAEVDPILAGLESGFEGSDAAAASQRSPAANQSPILSAPSEQPNPQEECAHSDDRRKRRPTSKGFEIEVRSPDRVGNTNARRKLQPRSGADQAVAGPIGGARDGKPHETSDFEPSPSGGLVDRMAPKKRREPKNARRLEDIESREPDRDRNMT